MNKSLHDFLNNTFLSWTKLFLRNDLAYSDIDIESLDISHIWRLNDMDGLINSPSYEEISLGSFKTWK